MQQHPQPPNPLHQFFELCQSNCAESLFEKFNFWSPKLISLLLTIYNARYRFSSLTSDHFVRTVQETNIHIPNPPLSLERLLNVNRNIKLFQLNEFYYSKCDFLFFTSQDDEQTRPRRFSQRYVSEQLDLLNQHRINFRDNVCNYFSIGEVVQIVSHDLSLLVGKLVSFEDGQVCIVDEHGMEHIVDACIVSSFDDFQIHLESQKRLENSNDFYILANQYGVDPEHLKSLMIDPSALEELQHLTNAKREVLNLMGHDLQPPEILSIKQALDTINRELLEVESRVVLSIENQFIHDPTMCLSNQLIVNMTLFKPDFPSERLGIEHCIAGLLDDMIRLTSCSLSGLSVFDIFNQLRTSLSRLFCCIDPANLDVFIQIASMIQQFCTYLSN
ncbi:hypothetical protein P9112_013990 [Eukaryota sp. TZLM1-RC]